jgi:hypothetical protein
MKCIKSHRQSDAQSSSHQRAVKNKRKMWVGADRDASGGGFAISPMSGGLVGLLVVCVCVCSAAQLASVVVVSENTTAGHLNVLISSSKRLEETVVFVLFMCKLFFCQSIFFINKNEEFVADLLRSFALTLTDDSESIVDSGGVFGATLHDGSRILLPVRETHKWYTGHVTGSPSSFTRITRMAGNIFMGSIRVSKQTYVLETRWDAITQSDVMVSDKCMFSVQYNLFVAWVPSGKVARRLGVKYVFFGLLEGLSKGPLDPHKTPDRVLYPRVEHFLRFTRPYGNIDTYCWNPAQTTPKVSDRRQSKFT